MSLINEALKKAQRQRHDEQAELGAPLPGGGARVTRRQKSLSTQTIVLLAGSGIALFVVCVVGAVLWINRPAPTKPAPPRPEPTPSTVAAAPAQPPPLVVTPAPVATKPAAPVEVRPPLPAPSAVPAPATPVPSMTSARSEPVIDLASAPSTEPPPRVITVPNLPAAKFEERIQTIVDSWRVAGIRSSPSGSRVLLNERVYKLNDVVDRTNGLRLTKIASDQLTFTTAEGIDYVKTF
jgi:hypothetical protein